MPPCKMHNVRFYRPKPNAVYCMALHSQTKRLAVSRADATIELWNLCASPFVEKVITSTIHNYSIEGLAWCGSRLFSVGLHGLLIEYNLLKLCIKNRAVVTGEAAFCLDINKNGDQIAIGTEQGYLNIFSVHKDEVMFDKFLDKQEGRILCLKYDHSGEFVVSGGLDAIRIWSVATGHALHKMTTGRAEAKKPTIVWCLEITQDFTIITGDSRGKLTFWDGKIGSQVESHQSHKADILALCLSEDQTSLFCAGIDSNIVNYVSIEVKDGSLKWVKSIQRRIHDHDVRALVLHKNKLYSSGADGYLACSYHPPKTLLKYPPIMQNPVQVCTQARLVLLRHPNSMEVWSLGDVSEEDKSNGLLKLTKGPTKLLVLQKIVKDSNGQDKKEGIICSVISDDGKYIAYSSRHGIKIFKLIITNDNEKPDLLPVEIPDNFGENPCLVAVFNETNCLIAANSGAIQVFQLENDLCPSVQLLDTGNKFSDTVSLITTSGKFLAVSDCQSNICVWILKAGEYVFSHKLPKLTSSPTAMAIHPKLLNIVVAYSDNNIVEYSLEHRKLTDFSRSLSKSPSKQWKSRNYTVRNITFDLRVDHIIILHDDNSIVTINKEKKLTESAWKIPRIDLLHTSGDGSDRKFQETVFHSMKKYKHLVHLSWLSDDEMVAVEVSPLSLVEQLPPCFVQNTFGRK